jgi:hypothetical protein
MIGKSKYILIAVLTLCACSHTPTSPPSSIKSTPIQTPTATATIDFGVVPLWRETDTIFTLHLNSLDSITAILLSDSDWIIQKVPIAIRKTDSSVVLNIRYQPRSPSKHVGNIVLLMGNDTLGLISLNGNTSPFVRHIGDTYIFQTLTGLDTIRVTSIPDSFHASGISFFDLSLNYGTVDSSGDLLLDLTLNPSRMPVSTCIAANQTYHETGVRSNFRDYSWNASCGSDTTIIFEGASLDCINVQGNGSYSYFWNGDQGMGIKSLSLVYSPSIHFFTAFQGSDNGGVVNGYLIEFQPGP